MILKESVRVIGFLFILIFFTRAFPKELVANDFGNSHFRGFHVEGVHGRGNNPIDVGAIDDYGANIVRISVFLDKDVQGKSEYILSAEDFNYLYKVIEDLESRNIVSLIVLRTRGDERSAFWGDARLRKSFIKNWRSLAKQFLSKRNYVAFDLMNEPVPPGRNYDQRQKVWLDFASELSTSIREIDPNRVLIIESAPDSTPTSFGNMVPLNIGNVVYSFHSYSPIALTHQGVMAGLNKVLIYGFGADYTRADILKYFDPVVRFQEKYGVPVLVGEFSMVRFAPLNSSTKYISDSISYFEDKGWSWIYHDFRGWTGWDSEVGSDEIEFHTRSSVAPTVSVLHKFFQRNRRN